MNIVDYINSTVFCTLRASPICGVGVFAIRDIAKGTVITDNYGQKPTIYSVSEDEFSRLLPEIQTLIRQRTIFRKNVTLKFNSPNSLQLLEAFMNHSDNPNSDGISATRDIKKGEEVTKNYVFLQDPHPLNADILKI